MTGLEGTGIEVVYQQPLRICEVGGRVPGLHLVLRAGPDATSARVAARSADGATGCDAPVRLAVAPRLHLGGTTLRALRGGRYRLELDAAPGVDLSQACADAWRFDAGDGPTLRLLGPPRCERRRIRATVAVTGEQLQPANVILTGVRLAAGAAGEPTEAVFQAWPPRPAWLGSMPKDAARWVDVAGIRTRYFERGRGAPLVLVHGGQAGGENNHAEVWEPVLPRLARHFRVIALDRLAQGDTENLPDRADYARYYERDAEHLWSFIEALGLRKVTLVGHSQGGYPATAVALGHPAAIRCLVNVDSVLVPDDPAPMQAALGFIAYYATVLNPADGPTFYSARRGLRLRGPSGHNISDAEAHRIAAQARDPKTLAARADMAAMRLTPLHPSFKALRDGVFARIERGELTVPTLVIWGAEDPQVPLPLGEQLYGRIAGAGGRAALDVIPNAGHFPFVDQPGAFAASVVRFCGGV